ncbi:MAG: hypothetical protein UT30_C0010G0015 [Candidatus Uhrbacteria bacterium GW2011_GWF2_39_13]|uniref:Uncharacterized protein n=1 Tax=Candidatus Uhrbacteria bacterium GW2011_GWF2_39_13 TaxID=1618995 RepID=A0A0G0MUZ8_9BACT|nr:MAG: hypothetical protein UT30_C0010G0015 [Candidatus Uhrbacteria bacterium GW2011_GWF2_39_13]HAU65795.1 hypothetical protein [Candidatus Uhrbacteria bacterium]
MASPLAAYLTETVIKRHFEEVAEKTITAGIAAGDNENTLARRVLKATFGPNSALVVAVQAIPGLRYAPHLILGAVSEMLNKHALNLWPGDNRPSIRALRMVLKNTAPALLGIGDATADVLERRVDEAIGKVISASDTAPTDRKAALDLIVVVPDYYGMRPFFPVRTDAEGKIVLTEQGTPVVLDREFTNFSVRWIREHPKTKISTGGGRNGQGQTTQEIAPTAPWQVYSFQEWLTLVDSADEIGTEVIAALRKQFMVPKSWDHQISEETWATFRAAIRTRRALQCAGRRTWMDRQDFEKLVEKMLQVQPPALRVNQLIGAAFFERIGQDGAPPGCFCEEALVEFEDTLDIFLGGEQDKLTKIIRAVCEIKRVVAKQQMNPIKAVLAIAGLTSVIWMPILAVVSLLILSAMMFVQGVFTPLTGTVPYLGMDVSAKAFALWMTFASGWLAFVVTISFPIFQMASSWIRTLFPSMRDDWLTSIGRRIVAFGLLVCSGMEFYAVALNLSPLMRMVILASCGVGVALSMALVEAGYRAQAELAVKNSYKPLLFLFGILPLGIAYVYGTYQGNPEAGTAIGGGLTTAWNYIQSSKMVQSLLFLLGVIGLGALVRLVEKARVVDGYAVKERIPGSRWAIGILTIVGLIAIWFNEPPKKDIPPAWNSQVQSTDLTYKGPNGDVRVKQQIYEDGLTKTQIKGQVEVNSTPVQQRPVPVPKTSNKQLCDEEKLPFSTCQALGYK